MTSTPPHVVIVGAGFGGLQCAKSLVGLPVAVTIVDRRNYHLFTPLLYQVASCLLSPSEIAAPLRKVFRGAANVRYRQAEVVHVDTDGKRVHLVDGTALAYDVCVLATGSVTNYYGNQPVEQHALGLKDLGEALQLRNHVLECLEHATTADDADTRRHLLTFCIVGGGPTGVEYAGALAEFVRLVLPHEYPEIPTTGVHIVLLEGGDRRAPDVRAAPLGVCAAASSSAAESTFGLSSLVASADDRGVVLHDGSELLTATMVWTAGVRPADLLHEPLGAHRRSTTTSGSSGAEGLYAIGDVAAGSVATVRCCRCCHHPRCRPAATSRARSCEGRRPRPSATATRAPSQPSAVRRRSGRSAACSSRGSSGGSCGWSCTSTT